MKARTNFEKGKIIVKFFLGVDVFWRNMVHHWRDPSGLAQLSKCKFSTSCKAKIVAVLRASSMQPLHSDANWQRQARSVCSRGDAGVTLDIVNHTAEATSRSLSWVLCRAPAENQLREDVVELVAPPPRGSTTPEHCPRHLDAILFRRQELFERTGVDASAEGKAFHKWQVAFVWMIHFGCAIPPPMARLGIRPRWSGSVGTGQGIRGLGHSVAATSRFQQGRRPLSGRCRADK